MSAPVVPRAGSAPPVAQDASRAAAGTVALAALQVLGRVLALAFVVAATRTVMPAEFGRYSIVAGLVGLLVRRRRRTKGG